MQILLDPINITRVCENVFSALQDWPTLVVMDVQKRMYYHSCIIIMLIESQTFVTAAQSGLSF